MSEDLNLIGRHVVFSINKQDQAEGIVRDKIIMREGPDSSLTITGYIIESMSGGILYPNIAHWRLRKIFNQ
jgi:hypothetical protein